MEQLYRAHVASLTTALSGLVDHLDVVDAAAAAMAESLRVGGKVLAAGNGGSAAEAQHLTAELLGRLRPDRDRGPLPAVALHADTSTLTAAGNDYGYDAVFARQVQALGREGDVFVGLSTSGSSANVVHAAEAARDHGMVAIALVGATDGPLQEVSDHVLAVPSTEIGAIQEAHLVLVHVLVERTEDLLFGETWPTA